MLKLKSDISKFLIFTLTFNSLFSSVSFSDSSDLSESLTRLQRSLDTLNASEQGVQICAATTVQQTPVHNSAPRVEAVDKNLCIPFDESVYKSKTPPALLQKPEKDSETQIKNFLKYMIPLAIHFQEKYGIPADLNLVNAILLSSWGRGDDFLKYNNPFSVRCSEVTGPKEKLKCSPDRKYFHFDNIYEGFDFHIRLLYFSDHYPGLKKQTSESLKKSKLINRSELVAAKTSLINDWNNFGGYNPNRDQYSYHQKINVLLKDWFSKIDYSKISICKDEASKPTPSPSPRVLQESAHVSQGEENPRMNEASDAPINERQRNNNTTLPQKENPRKSTSHEELSQEALRDVRESFENERAFGHYSPYIRVNGVERYNPGDPDHFSDFVLFENQIELNSPVRNNARISSGFGYRVENKRVREHGGIDVAATEGSPLYSMGSGVVRKSGYSSTYGFYVLIQLKDKDGNLTPFSVLYAHLKGENTRDERNQQRRIASNIPLPALRGIDQARAGDEVDSQTVVGRVGQTGVAEGPHLHFELLYNWSDGVNSGDSNRVYTTPYRVNPEFYPTLRTALGIENRKKQDEKKFSSSKHKNRIRSNHPYVNDGFIYQ